MRNPFIRSFSAGRDHEEAGRVNIAILDKVSVNFRKLHDLTGLKEITDEVWRLHGDPVEDGQSYPSNIGDNADNIPHPSDEIKGDPENARGARFAIITDTLKKGR